MNGAAVIRWGAGIPGRETKGMEVFAAAVERFEGLAKAGRIHDHAEYIALTGSTGGMLIAQGDVTELQKMLVEPETLSLNAKAASIVEDFEIQLYATGEQSVNELMGNYLTSLGELGYA